MYTLCLLSNIGLCTLSSMASLILLSSLISLNVSLDFERPFLPFLFFFKLWWDLVAYYTSSVCIKYNACPFVYRITRPQVCSLVITVWICGLFSADQSNSIFAASKKFWIKIRYWISIARSLTCFWQHKWNRSCVRCLFGNGWRISLKGLSWRHAQTCTNLFYTPIITAWQPFLQVQGACCLMSPTSASLLFIALLHLVMVKCGIRIQVIFPQ